MILFLFSLSTAVHFFFCNVFPPCSIPFSQRNLFTIFAFPYLRIGVEEEIWPEEIWRTRLFPRRSARGGWLARKKAGRKTEKKKKCATRLHRTSPSKRKKVGENLYRYLSDVSGSRMAGKLSPPSRSVSFAAQLSSANTTRRHSNNYLSKSERYRLNRKKHTSTSL